MHENIWAGGQKILKTANTTMAPAHPLCTRSHGGPRTETMTHFPEDMIMGLASMPFRPPHTTNDREWPKNNASDRMTHDVATSDKIYGQADKKS